MIRRYNRNQILLSLGQVVLGLVGISVGFLLILLTVFCLSGAIALLSGGLPETSMVKQLPLSTGLALVVYTVSFCFAWKIHRRNRNLEPGLMNTSYSPQPDLVSPAARRLHGDKAKEEERYTEHGGISPIGMTFGFRNLQLLWSALVRLYLFGPTSFFIAIDHLKNLIPPSPEMESRLRSACRLAEGFDNWHGIENYRYDPVCFNYLIRMGYLDYSSTKGVVKLNRRMVPFL